ncbi:hypothetical protein CVT24_002907 [Panaeolus cyanescens]|uniref:Mid2 domain-containing protein n=1 Tax=Panaeolus cyanescens TaxID=181874 RepID=A0A409W8M5_9AGAR|nr:hypothetical protein CVT24_002907 [Panaeolus cyanescens]
MFGGFRGPFGSGAGNTFRDPFFPSQGASSPTFVRPTFVPSSTPPASDDPSPTGNPANGGSTTDSQDSSAATPVGNDNDTPRSTIGTNNGPQRSTITHSITLPPPPPTTIITTATKGSVKETSALSVSPAASGTQAASVATSRKHLAPIGLIVGVLFSGVFVTLAVLLALLWVRRRRRKKKALGATPYRDITHADSDAQLKERSELAQQTYLPPYTPPATSSVAASTSSGSISEKSPLAPIRFMPSRTTMQVANRESVTEAARSRWSSSTTNTAFQPPRYATLFRIQSRHDARHPSREHLPLPPPLPQALISPKSIESEPLSYATR